MRYIVLVIATIYRKYLARKIAFDLVSEVILAFVIGNLILLSSLGIEKISSQITGFASNNINISPAISGPLIAGIFAIVVAVVQLRKDRDLKKEELDLKDKSEIQLVLYEKIHSISKETQLKLLQEDELKKAEFKKQLSLIAKLKSLVLKLESYSIEQLQNEIPDFISSYEKLSELGLTKITQALEQITKKIKKESNLDVNLIDIFKKEVDFEYKKTLKEIEDCESSITSKGIVLRKIDGSYKEVLAKELPPEELPFHVSPPILPGSNKELNVERLKKGAREWNSWRRARPSETIDLSGADLNGANLTRADLTRADLTGANLTGADLTGADLTGADLTRAYLKGANLNTANLEGAKLERASFMYIQDDLGKTYCTDLRGAKNLTPEQLKNVVNKEEACYDLEFRKKLGLLPENPKGCD